MPDKLKPCPFCGNKAIVYSNMDRHHKVECSVCHVRTLYKLTKTEALRIWNRRISR